MSVSESSTPAGQRLAHERLSFGQTTLQAAQFAHIADGTQRIAVLIPKHPAATRHCLKDKRLGFDISTLRLE